MTILYADAQTQQTLTGPRLRARRVDEHALAAETAARAAERGRPAVTLRHGGSVAKRYPYPAETEAVLAVALDGDTVVIWARRCDAKSVTFSAAAGAYWRLFDGRTSETTKAAAREQLIADARRVAQEARDAA